MLVIGVACRSAFAAGVEVEISGESTVSIVDAPVASASRDITDNLQKVREGEDFHYVIEGLPKRETLQIELGFAETRHEAAGMRVFDVSLNGREVISGMDLFAETGGMRRALVKTLQTKTTDGKLDLHFQARVDRALIGFIRVQTPAGASVMIKPQVPGEAGSDGGLYAPWNRDTGEILQDSGHKPWKSGVPLGGIGTGSMEILSNGDFANLTINNAWDRPLGRQRGTFFAVVAKSRSGRGEGRILRVPDARQPAEFVGVKTIDSAVHRGLFPFTELEFHDDTFPLKTKLKAWSPLVPGRVADSSMPVAMFEVEVTNPNKVPVAAGVAFSWQDVSAQLGKVMLPGQVGLLPQVVRNEAGTSTVLGVRLSAERPLGAGMLPIADYFVGAETSRTVVTQVMHWDPYQRAIPWWSRFEKTCRLERRGGAKAVAVKSRPGASSASVVCATLNLAPGETRTAEFVVGWFVPEVVTASTGQLETVKQEYTERFSSSVGVATHATARRAFLKTETARWHDMVMNSNLQRWLRVRLVNALAPLVRNSLFLQGGRFSQIESLEDRAGRVGNLEFGLLGEPMLSTFFPSLVVGELDAFAARQDPEGRIPDSLGALRSGLMAPMFAGMSGRQDATLAFLLQARGARETSPTAAFVAAMDKAAEYVLSAARQAGETSASTSTGTPNISDAWFMHAALVAAGKTSESLTLLGPAVAGQTHTASGQAVDPATGGYTLANGLRGAWAARAVARGRGLEPRDGVSALALLLSRHKSERRPLPAMVVAAAGEDTTSPVAMGSMETYLGVLAIAVGLPDDGLDVLRRCYETVWGVNHDPWNQALAYDPVTGRAIGWGGHMSAVSAWNALDALHGMQIDWPAGTMVFDPRAPRSLDGRLRVPVFDSRIWGELEYDDRLGTASLRVLHVMPSVAGEDATTPTLRSLARRRAADGTPENPVTLPIPFEAVEGNVLHLDQTW